MSDIIINTEQEFIDIPINNNENDNFILNKDLDFTGLIVDFTNFSFNGYIDGQGYKISNITLIRDGQSQFYLFYRINELKNLIIENLTIDGNNNALGGNAIIYTGTKTTIIDNLNIKNPSMINIAGSINSLLLRGGYFNIINKIKITEFNLDVPWSNQGIIFGGTLSINDFTANITNITIENSSIKGRDYIAPLITNVDITNTGILNVNNNKIILTNLEVYDNPINYDYGGGLIGRIKLYSINAFININNNIVKITNFRGDKTSSAGIIGYASLSNQDYANNLTIENNLIFIENFYSKYSATEKHAHIVDSILSYRPNENNNYYFINTNHYYEDNLGIKTNMNYNWTDSDLVINLETELKQQATYNLINFNFINIWNIDEGNSLPYQNYLEETSPEVESNKVYIKINNEWVLSESQSIKTNGGWQ